LNFKCPLGFNAAEYYVSLLGIELDKEADSRERIRKICDEYQRSDIASDIDSRVGDVQDEMEVKVNYFVQFYWLMWRNIQSVKHNSTIWIAEFLLLMPILFASLVFGVAGLRGGFVGWMWFCIVCVLCANYANAYGSFLSSVFNSMETAALFSVPFELIGTMFSGLYLNLGSLNHYVSWLRFLSPFYYGVESISILQWDSIESINCVKIAGMPCLSTGPEVLDRYGFAEAHFWRNLSSLAIMYCIAHTIAYVMVIKRSSFLSATFDRMETAALISVPIDLIGIMFSGIYLNLASVKPYFSWLKYISGFYYGTECVSILQWNLIDDINCVNMPGIPCIRTGKGVLTRFGYDEMNFWRNCACLMA
ncbi:putative scarlet, partial [Operophtera brumata]